MNSRVTGVMVLFIMGALSCKSAPTPQPVGPRAGLVARKWHLPSWDQRAVQVTAKHAFVSTMTHVDALHLNGGVWFSESIQRNANNQSTWVMDHHSHLLLRYGLKEIEVYDLLKRRVLTRVPCGAPRCGRASILSTQPVVLQLNTRRTIVTSVAPEERVMGKDGLRPPTKTMDDRRWLVLQDKPWKVAWHWGESVEGLGAEARVDGDRLVLVDQQRVRLLSLDTGKLLKTVPLPVKPQGHQSWAIKDNTLLWSTTRGHARDPSTLVLMDMSVGKVIHKKVLPSLTIRRVFSADAGWVVGADAIAQVVTTQLQRRWQSNVSSTLSWPRAVVASSSLYTKDAAGVLTVFDLNTGKTRWSFDTGVPGPIAVDLRGRVMTNLKGEHLGLLIPAP